MDSSTLSKSALRKMYLEERKSFSKEKIEDYSKGIFENFLKFIDLSEVKKAHCFLPIKKFKEINTQFLIDYFWLNDIDVFIPKVIGDDMISIKFDKTTELVENSWGILEPRSNEDNSGNFFDIVITPLLYCDHNGNRVGYGTGFYDKFFTKLNSNALKFGVNFFDPNGNIFDISDNDVKLNGLITPTKIFNF